MAAKKSKLPVRSKHNVMGLVHPYRPEYQVKGNVPVGTTVHDAIRTACETAKVRRRLINYGIAQIGRRDYEKQITRWEFIPFSQWKKHKLAADEILRFRILPKGGGGGGGGKGVMNTILNVVVAVAAIAASAFTFGALGTLGLGLIGSTIGAGLAGMATLTIGQALTNAIAPVSAPSLPGISSISNQQSHKESDVYSISGGRNSINQWGRVPVPVGRGRWAPPKAAAPYTFNVGDDQYLCELFCLGIGDMAFSGHKIGGTPFENFQDCCWEIIQTNTSGTSRPKYYKSGIYQNDLNIQLKYNETQMRVTEECTSAIIDLSFQGLCNLDNYGNPRLQWVDFEIRYKKTNGDAWTGVGEKRFFNGMNLWHPPSQGYGWVYITYEFGIGVDWGGNGNRIDNAIRLGMFTWYRQGNNNVCEFRRSENNGGVSINGFDVTAQSGPMWWGLSITSGYIEINADGAVSPVYNVRVQGQQTRLLRYSYELNFPSRGVYTVAITRVIQDNDNTRIKDESYWTALRSCTNDPPVQTKYPVMLMSVQIKASGQISGAIDTFTTYYETKCFDFANGSWKWQYTSNSAAIMRYILQQEHCWARPQPTEWLDLPSFERAYRFCEEKGFNYNKVFDASVSVFERLVSVGASCLASPTMIDGKWGVIIDAPRENVVCAFTSANAWNWAFERSQTLLPDSIHCDFVNEETWEADMRVVDTDEVPSGHYLFETQNYDGVTNAKQVWYLARFHYADAKMRRRTITFKAYDEAIMCTRGDLVELCCPNVNVAGLQVGRVRKVIRNSSGAVTGFTTDQINATDFSGRQFGAKIYAKNGDVYHVRIKPEGKAQRALNLLTPQNINIESGDKYAYSDYNEETFQAVVLSLKYNSDWTCEVVCQDYTPGIYGDLSKPVPDFESIITRPIEYKWTISSIPIIKELVSDESVLLEGPNGSLICRILAYMADPPNLDSRAKFYDIEIRKVLDENGDAVLYESWRNAARGVPIDQKNIFLEGVDEGATYEIRARYTGIVGEYGEWCEPVRHRVEGALAPPPDVENFQAIITNPEGIWLSWDMLDVKDIHYYKIWGAAFINAVASPVLHKPYRQTGILPFWIVAVDRGGRESVNPTYAWCEVFPPKDVVILNAELLEEGVIASWEDAFTTWDLQYYRIRVREYEAQYQELSCIIPWSGRFYKNEPFKVRAYDIFENWSVSETSKIVTIYPPLTPEIKLDFDKTNGMVTIDWQDCKNPTKPNTPSIDYYEITGTLAMGKPVQVKGLHYESIVPLKVYEFGAGTVPGGIEVNVGNLHIKVSAVDKYGIRSEDADDYKDNSVDFEIRPPYNPSNFGFSATLIEGDDLEANWTQSTAIMLTWRDCERTFAIDHYTVYDSYTDTEYKVATNYIVLPVRPQGKYPVTVQAFDVLGLSSAAMTYNMMIGGVGGMEVTGKVDGSDILLEWSVPDASFQIDHYIIMADNDTIPSGTNSDKELDGYLGEAKFNFYRVPAKETGEFTFYVWAVDVAGNVSKDYASYATVTVEPNGPPTITARVDGIGVALEWERLEVENALPVSAWEVRRYPKLESAEDISNYTPIQDYGRLDITKTNVNAFLEGDYSFAVRAIDTGGNYGDWGLCDFIAKAPGQVVFTNATVVDNNVQLYWTEPNYKFFEIKEYIFAEVQEDDKGNPVHMEIGRVDALFTATIEEVPGDYVYSITPLDWGGNRGVPNMITLTVNWPPDFQYFDAFDSLFNGEKINMVLDGRGAIVGPFLESETWEENREHASLLAGHEIVTHEDKVNAGFTLWPQPEEPWGQYIETINHGASIDACFYKINLDYRVLVGTPQITIKIEKSIDGTIWEDVIDNGIQVFMTNFQYSRITITVTGGVVRITRLNLNLNVKKITDFGRAHCDKDDNGEGWISEAETPMLTGTWVPFNQVFMDVQSLPKPNVVNREDYIAFTVFEDVLTPKGFRIFVKDKDGNRVTADVDWVANGV